MKFFGGIFDVRGKQERILSITAQSSEPGFWENAERAQKMEQERARLETVVSKIVELSSMLENTETTIALLEEEPDPALEADLAQTLQFVSTKIQGLELQSMMSGSHDANSAILEIHAGAGGADAQDWALMLYRMYKRWCERRGFEIEEVDFQAGEEAGIKGATLFVRGEYAYGWLRSEGGVHRLVRISPFDSNHRRHTAFSAVRITPEFEDDEALEIDWEKEVREDRFHASGAGGQHVNKTESAIRLTHLATGIVVQCQNERSQHKNRSTARKIMMARLLDYEEAKREAARANAAEEKLKIEWGSQIRSYVNHPYMMVKDHRSDAETPDFDGVLDGDLDRMMESYLLSTRAENKLS